MKPLHRLLFIAGAVAATLPAHAQSLRSFDDFSSGLLDASNWLEQDIESVRTVNGGRAVLARRSFGGSGSDSGAGFESVALSFGPADRVTAIAADVTIDAAEATGCAANPTPSATKLRLGGAFFNAGTRVEGSSVDDVVAQLVWSRSSDSTDPAGTLKVSGMVLRCTTADCSGFQVIGNTSSMGTVEAGGKLRVKLVWNRASKSFTFRRSPGLPLTVNYTEDDAQAASKPGKSFSVRNTSANCSTPPRGTTLLRARIDNVAVNSDAF